MADDTKFDVYADGFTVTVTPFGSNLSFSLREAHPSPSAPQVPRELGTIRMSTEHLKTVVWLCRKQVREVEGKMGVTADVPVGLLNQLGVSPDDWTEFWRPISGI